MPRVVSRSRDDLVERHDDDQDSGVTEGGVTSALLGLRGSSLGGQRSAASRNHEEAALAEAALEEEVAALGGGFEAPSGSPDFLEEDSDPELLEEDCKGRLTDAARRRHGPHVPGTPAPFGVLPYPLLRVNAGGSQTRAEAALNLLLSLLSPAVLVVPRAMANVGVASGVVLMASTAAANRYTLLLMLWMNESMLDETSFPDMGRHVFGQAGLLVVLVSYLLLTCGMLVAYLVVIADALSQLNGLGALPRLALVLAAGVACLPGAALRSLRHSVLLGCASAVGVVALLVSLVAVLAASEAGERPIVAGEFEPVRGGLRELVSSVALFSLLFSAQAGGMELLTHISQPEDPHLAAATDDEAVVHHGHEASDLQAARAVSALAFSLALLGSACVGAAACGRLGASVEGNVLLSLGAPAPLAATALARVLYVMVLVASVAFLMVPCRSAALDLLCRRRHDVAGASVAGRDTKATMALLVVSVLVAWRVQDLAELLEFVGVWATMVLAYVLPCGFAIELRRRTENLPVLGASNALPLALIGCALAVIAISGCDIVFGVMARFAQSQSAPPALTDDYSDGPHFVGQ